MDNNFYGRHWVINVAGVATPEERKIESDIIISTVNNLQWLAYQDGLIQGGVVGVVVGLLISLLIQKK